MNANETNADRGSTGSTGSTGATVWIGRIISTLVVALLLMSATMKLRGGPEFEETSNHLGLRPAMTVPLAIIEITCAVIYSIPATSVVGAILLTGYMGGAICSHWRVEDLFVVQVVVPVLVWLGLYLREKRLHQLIPLRRQS